MAQRLKGSKARKGTLGICIHLYLNLNLNLDLNLDLNLNLYFFAPLRPCAFAPLGLLYLVQFLRYLKC